VQPGPWREFKGQGCVRDRHQKEQEMKHFRHEKRNGPGDECVSRSLGEPNSSQASSAENVIRQWNCGGAPAQEAAGHPRRCRMKLEQVKLIQTYVEYVCPLSPMQAIIAIFNV